MESEANRPQADSIARELADMDARLDFPEEPDFSSFKPEVRESLLPRWLQLSPMWVLGFGAVAAVIVAGMFLSQQRKTDKTLELLAVSSRALNVPAAPAVAPLAEKKPTDMVFLQNAGQTEPARAERTEPAAAAAVRPATASAARPATSVAAKPARVKAKTGAGVAPIAKAAVAKAKPVAKKKSPKRKKVTAVATRNKTQTWPSRRGDSITERLNAAVRACRARPHGPGDCNLRACDILGSSDPACR